MCHFNTDLRACGLRSATLEALSVLCNVCHSTEPCAIALRTATLEPLAVTTNVCDTVCHIRGTVTTGVCHSTEPCAH